MNSTGLSDWTGLHREGGNPGGTQTRPAVHMSNVDHTSDPNPREGVSEDCFLRNCLLRMTLQAQLFSQCPLAFRHTQE